MDPCSQRSIRRALLRECRRLGPSWTPSPPASDLFWGKGYYASDPSQPSPLLIKTAPDSIHSGLRMIRKRPFAPWLRETIRNDSWDTPSSISTARAVGSKEQDALEFLHKQSTLAPCTTSSESSGLRVDAVSGFRPQDPRRHRDPGEGAYVFVYNMRFTNVGHRPLRILSREYNFREESGALRSQIKAEQIEAAGVVGYTPKLEPGQVFEFGSGVVLNSPRGHLTGRFNVMLEPAFTGEDLEVHKHMEEAELLLRYMYFKDLDAAQFWVPLGKLHFDADVRCIQITRGGV